MQRLSAAIKEAIESKYGSVAKFSRLIDIPYSTLNNILKNGFDNSKFSMVVDICRRLEVELPEQRLPELDEAEVRIIRKYSLLDNRGRRLVENIVEQEYKRCIKF